jgi:hypothetical protein
VGTNVRVRGSYLRDNGNTGLFPRVALWVVPTVGSGPLDVSLFKATSDFFSLGVDYQTLYADENTGSGANFATRTPATPSGASPPFSSNLAATATLSSAGALVLSTTGLAPSAGAAASLPSAPAGYLTIDVNGTPRKIPYY